MIESVPSMAPSSPPLIGASSMSTPASASSPAIVSVTVGEMVDMSISVIPAESPSTTGSASPSPPSTTVRTSGESGRQVITTSLSRATPAGAPPSAPPSATSSSTGSGDRLCPTTS